MPEEMDGGRGSFRVAEEEKLELRLGLPGEDRQEDREPWKRQHSVGSSSSSLNYPSAGAKRAFFDAPEFDTEAFRKPRLPERWVEKCRTSSSPVVGWPPIRSSRKNFTTSKPTKEISSEKEANQKSSNSSGLFIKINMDGIPIGRKIDLRAYDGYLKLHLAVDELFRDLLAARGEKSRCIPGLWAGSGEHALVYEDDEGDRMLVGDVPWDMFVSTARRLRVLRSSDVPFCNGMKGKRD